VGLTLLELVIALSILSLLGVLALEAVRIASRSWRRGEERADLQQRVRVLAAMLAADLSAVHAGTASVAGRPVLAFTGTGERVQFQAAPDPHEPAPRSGMVRSLAYSVDPGRGLILQKSYPLTEEEEAGLEPRGRAQVLDPSVRALRLRYLAAARLPNEEPRWESAWGPREPESEAERHAGAAATPGQSGLPLAVEVTLELGEGRDAQQVQVLVPLRTTNHGP